MLSTEMGSIFYLCNLCNPRLNEFIRAGVANYIFAAGKINYGILWQSPLNFTLCGLTKSSMQN
jgi:hypothetical protein